MSATERVRAVDMTGGRAQELLSAPEARRGREAQLGCGRNGKVDVDANDVREHSRGVDLSRYIDAETAELRRIGMKFRDVQQTRLRFVQHQETDRIVKEFQLYEERVRAALKRALRAHPLWPWLSQFRGLGGANVALLMSAIGDPRRFPGQRCSIGHFHPPVYAVGVTCPNVADVLIENGDARGDDDHTGAAEARIAVEWSSGCPGVMLPPRTTTGVRSVWHYCGLFPDNTGHSVRKRKGQRMTWNPLARMAVQQPDGGIAAQIVRLNVSPYRAVYDAAKDRLARERGTVSADAIESLLGVEGAAAPGPLRPIEVEHRARTIAAKAFVGDLLVAWKEIA